MCTTMLATGTLVVRLQDREPVPAVRLTAAADPSGGVEAPAEAAVVEVTTTVPPRISLYDLVSALRAKSTPSTTGPTTTVTRRPVPVPSTSSTTTTAVPVAGAKPQAPFPTSTTVTTTPLTPLTTLLQNTAAAAAAVFGQASWFNAPDGTCAHRDLPMGTIVKVTRVSTGMWTTCRVNDRGPTLATNRLIDLSLDTFEKLAASEAGVITVQIEW